MNGKWEKTAERIRTIAGTAPAIILQTWIGVWVAQSSELGAVQVDDTMSFPERVLAIFGQLDGWGIETCIFFLGLLCVFFYARREETFRDRWLTALCWIFAVGTVLGKSYYETASWEYVFGGIWQLWRALFVLIGYFLLYRHGIAFCIYWVKRGQWLRRGEAANRLERFLFETHPFGGPLLVIALFSVPYVILFFPGTLQWDALGQLWAYLGKIEWTGLYTVFNSMAMGESLLAGRNLFGSDNIGFFFYTFPQYAAQWVVFAYGMYLLNRMKAPVVLRWGSLAYLVIFPIWKMWGYTMAKDTWFYLCMLLFVLLLIDIETRPDGRVRGWQWALLILAPACGCLAKATGLAVWILTGVIALFICRRHWKIWVLCIAAAVLPVMIQNKVIQPALFDGVTSGPVNETMTVPLQQTARYLVYHLDEVTDEERAVLKEVFSCSLEELVPQYQPEISDDIKEEFLADADDDQLKAYYRVWFAQLCKHPATYIQAFLNQCYGFFYPNREMFNDTTARYRIGSDQEWTDGMEVSFGIDAPSLRYAVESYAELFERMPVVGMLYSAGLNNDILLGCLFYLCSRRKKAVFMLLPALGMVLTNLFSPVNAYTRYMLPVMIMLPFLIAWCHYVTCGGGRERPDDGSDQ